jgi:DNA-binding transcriptional regulator YiaG
MSLIPDKPVTFSEDDFTTASTRVRAARGKVLASERAAEAHRALGEQIAERIEHKRATLSEVRRAVGLTQRQLAETLGIEQGDLSKLERRHNLHLATLIRFIEATGGQLRLVAVYGDTEVDLDLDQVIPADPTSV